MNKRGEKKGTKAVAIWLLVGVLMIIVQIILGGITRLTDSGLSITEWQPLLGAIPPTSETEWNKAFEGYKQIAQYKYLNPDFTLSDFKSIYFWEWLHRNWGRLIGVVFAVPFIIFLLQKRFSKDMIIPMIVLFLLGGLQGAIGWIMVQSGLNDEDLYVSHIRLMIHFMSALGLLIYTLWFAFRLLIRKEQLTIQPTSKKWLTWIIGLLLVQLVYGAFMAGLKAATFAPTWPDINGSYLPPTKPSDRGFFSAVVNDPITVHFIHRNLAYLLAILIVIWTIKVAREKAPPLFQRWKWMPLLLVVIQVILGIAAVLNSVKKVPQRWGEFEWSAQLHQFVAMLLLLSLFSILFLHTRQKDAAQ